MDLIYPSETYVPLGFPVETVCDCIEQTHISPNGKDVMVIQKITPESHAWRFNWARMYLRSKIIRVFRERLGLTVTIPYCQIKPLDGDYFACILYPEVSPEEWQRWLAANRPGLGRFWRRLVRRLTARRA